MKLIIYTVAGLVLLAAISALPLEQEDPQLQEEVKSLLPSDQDKQQESIDTLKISTDGPEQDAARTKKSYYGSSGGTICMQVENGPYESPITMCRDEPSYGSGYHNQGTQFVPEHNGAGLYGVGPYGVANSQPSGFGGKPMLGLGVEYGHAGGSPYGVQSHPTGFGAEYGHLGGISYGAGPHGAVQSNHAGNGAGLEIGLGAGHQPEYGYVPLNVGPIIPSGLLPLGKPNVHSGNHGSTFVAPHHVPQYRTGELEMAEALRRSILTSLRARSAYQPSYGTGSYSSQYLGRPILGPGPVQGGFSNFQGGNFQVGNFPVAQQGDCGLNQPQGSPIPNSYGEYSQFSPHGQSGYKSTAQNTDNRDQSAKKLFEGAKPSELHGIRDELTKGPENKGLEVKDQKEIMAQMNSNTKA